MDAKTQQLSPQNYSDEVIQCVKSSNLHCVVNEPPFSVYITLRKKLINGQMKIAASEATSEGDSLKVELKHYKQICQDLVHRNEELENLIKQNSSEYTQSRKNDSNFLPSKLNILESSYLIRDQTRHN